MMKRETLFEVLGEIDDSYIAEARTYRGSRRSTLLKWGSAAACFVIIIMAAITLLPTVLEEKEPVVPHTTEAIFETRYTYFVTEGQFSSYVGGKVIAGEKIGDKLADVMVTAGWEDSRGVWTKTEMLRGEIYAIIDIPRETAVALKFLDQGEAITTTHWYVILNPEADLQAVEEYQILPWMPNNPGEAMAEAIPE